MGFHIEGEAGGAGLLGQGEGPADGPGLGEDLGGLAACAVDELLHVGLLLGDLLVEGVAVGGVSGGAVAGQGEAVEFVDGVGNRDGLIDAAGDLGERCHAVTLRVGDVGLLRLQGVDDVEELDGNLAVLRRVHVEEARVDDLDPELVERERQVLTEQARESGKPDNVIEKMIEGRIQKFYKEVVLLEQQFVMDPDRTVGKFIADEAGSDCLKGFVRFAVGEGIEKEESDFAAEVAAATKGS